MSQCASMVDTLQGIVKHYTEQAAIITPDSRISFRHFNTSSDRMAAGLQRRGIKKGDRIGLYSINCAEFAITYFAIIKAGAIAVPVNLLIKPPDVSYILNDAGVTGLVYHPLLSENVAAIRQQVPSLRLQALIGKGRNGSVLSTDELMEAGEDLSRISFDAGQDVASIIYTSGTTGNPKGAMLTHRNLISNTRSCFEALKLQPGRDILFTVLPMFHSFAHTVGMLLPLLHGCSFVPFPKFDPQGVVDAIASTGATVFMGVPTMYGVLLGLPEGEEGKFATVRYCISGGAAMPLSIQQGFESRFGKTIHEGDGPTECSPVTSVNPVDGTCKPGSIGIPVPDVEMAIFDNDGQQLADNEIGEIVVRGPNVMKGYWQQPEETVRCFHGDWYRTGDMGYRDEDGYFYIVDRIKDLVIVNGMNVYPKMVEKVLCQCPGVAEAAVVGQADELHGEVPVAFVTKLPGSDVDKQQLVRFCQDRLAKFEIPRTITFLQALPKTPAGKVLKRELRKQGETERGIAISENQA